VIEGRAARPAPTSRFAATVADDEGAAEPTTEAPGLSAALAGVDPEELRPATVDGAWKVIMSPPVGPQQEMTAIFHTDGTTLTGELNAAEGAQAFAGTVDGNHLKWEMKVTQPISLTLKYDLTVTGDTLSGKAKMGMFGSAKVAGTRL
jgi:carbon-monoxide dehydrogenase large subunit